VKVESDEGKTTPAIWKNLRWVCTASAGGCFIAIIQLATCNQLTESQLVAIGCFATALPIFAAAAGIPKLQHQDEHSLVGEWINYCLDGAFVLFAAGLTALLYSLGWIFAVLFAVVSIMLFFVIWPLPESKENSGNSN
jgi:hypothetical protein